MPRPVLAIPQGLCLAGAEAPAARGPGKVAALERRGVVQQPFPTPREYAGDGLWVQGGVCQQIRAGHDNAPFFSVAP